MKHFLLHLFIIVSNYSVIQSQPYPLKEWEYYIFDEKSNLKTNTLTNVFTDSLNQIWVINSFGLQYFDGEVYSEPIRVAGQEAQFTYMYLGLIGNKYLVITESGIVHLDIRSKKLLPYIHFTSVFYYAYFRNDDDKNSIIVSTARAHQFIKINLVGKQIEYINFKNLPQEWVDIGKQLYSRESHGTIELDVKKLKYVKSNKRRLHVAVFTGQNTDDCFYYELDKNVIHFSFNNNRNLSLSISDNIIRCRAFRLRNGNILLSLNRTLFEMDGSTNQIIYEYKAEDGSDLIKKGLITGISIDRYNNIYLSTVTEGLVKLIKKNESIRFFGDRKKDNNHTTFILPDKKYNRVLIGKWEGGLSIYDTNSVLIHSIDKIDDIKNPTVVRIDKVKDGYLLGIFNEARIYKLKLEKTGYTILSHQELERSYFGFYNKLINSNTFISDGRVYFLDRDKQKYYPAYNTFGVHQTTFYTLQDENYFIDGNEVKKLSKDFLTFSVIGKVNFPYAPVCMTHKNNEEFYVGTESGVYIYDAKNILAVPYITNIGTVYSLYWDSYYLWCGTNNGLIRINQDKELTIYTKYEGFQGSHYNQNNYIISEDGEYYFGGEDGVSSFYPFKLIKPEIPFSFLESISNGDSLYYYTGERSPLIYFDYFRSNFSCKLNVSGLDMPSRYTKQYLIEGLHKSWQNLNKQTSFELYLKPGEYKIYHHASLLFDSNAPKKNYFIVIISAPYYSTWWFRLIIVLAALGLVSYIVNLYNKLTFQRSRSDWEVKEKLLIQRSEFTRELHDLIGAQVSIVSRNINWIKEMLLKSSDSKIISKLEHTEELTHQINKDIRDTIWATKVEKLDILKIAERVQNFYYYLDADIPKLTIVNQVNKIENFVFQPIIGLNLLRIIQEAVHNSIKHSQARNLQIKLTDIGSKLCVEICDDGTGISNVNGDFSFGLENMRQRSINIGFDIVFNSSSSGTIITLTQK
ncbi:MAG TPA: hypothetical protein PKA12_00810 [Saprospiraceae bacterium]|nr:hypothetical protein [Saprospiraceae bacterium]